MSVDMLVMLYKAVQVFESVDEILKARFLESNTFLWCCLDAVKVS